MAGRIPYPLRLDEELSARVTAERARSRLGDPAWIQAAGREIREADGEILDLLSR